MDEQGRQKVIFYLLFNRSDIGDNIDISKEVRNFCLTGDCLKKTMMDYFGTEGSYGDQWCCSNCDLKNG